MVKSSLFSDGRVITFMGSNTSYVLRDTNGNTQTGTYHFTNGELHLVSGNTIQVFTIDMATSILIIN